MNAKTLSRNIRHRVAFARNYARPERVYNVTYHGRDNVPFDMLASRVRAFVFFARHERHTSAAAINKATA